MKIKKCHWADSHLLHRQDTYYVVNSNIATLHRTISWWKEFKLTVLVNSKWQSKNHQPYSIATLYERNDWTEKAFWK